MSVLQSYISQNDCVRGAEDALKNLRLIRDGSLSVIPWTQALVLEGRVFGVSFGAANMSTTVGTFGAEAAIDLDEIDMLQTIPATVAVMPLYFKCAFVAIGTIAATQVVLTWGAGGVGSAGITCTPYNLKPASSSVSACTVTGLHDNGGTAIVNAGVIFREATTALTGVAATPAQLGYEWTAGRTGFVPVIQGLVSPTRQIAAWAKAQGGTGYLMYQYAELPVSDVA